MASRRALGCLLFVAACAPASALPRPPESTGTEVLILVASSDDHSSLYATTPDPEAWAALPPVLGAELFVALYTEGFERLAIEPGPLESAPDGNPLPSAARIFSFGDDVWAEIAAPPFALSAFKRKDVVGSCRALGGCILEGEISCTLPCPCIPRGSEPVPVSRNCKDPGPFRGSECYAAPRPFTALNHAEGPPRVDQVGALTIEEGVEWLYFSSDRANALATDSGSGRAYRVPLAGPLALAGAPESLPLLPPASAVPTSSGGLSHVKVRPDGLEIFFETSFPHGNYERSQIWLASRTSLAEPFGAGIAPRRVNDPLMSPAAIADGIVHPLLLPDLRTLIVVHFDATDPPRDVRYLQRTFRRSTTRPGDTEFDAIDSGLGDATFPPESFALACDRRHIIYVRLIGQRRYLEIAPIYGYEPLSFGPPLPLLDVDTQLPIIFDTPGDLLLAESPDCNTLYFTTHYRTFARERVPCGG